MDECTENRISDLRPMDIYATHEVDFNMAAYCRGHKFSVEAVNLARTLRGLTGARAGLKNAEKLVESFEVDLLTAKAAVVEKMKRDPA